MKIRLLQWDSVFFGFDVFQINSNSKKLVLEALNEISVSEKCLVYVFLGEELFSKEELISYNGYGVDVKVVLRKSNLIYISNLPSHLDEYIKEKPNNELYELALESGKYSRFKSDNRLPENSFEKMYALWIENSCSSSTTKVFIYKEDVIKGFITLSISVNQIGEIGLIAVDENSQGKGIGKLLIQYAENYLVNNGVFGVTVPTQLDNDGAMSFYKRMGYEIVKTTNIYHFIFNNQR
jgi:dTDP-4-amino-4,6-dideoxy-D-galactose acyltransferase